jgi:hypothetical protein
MAAQENDPKLKAVAGLGHKNHKAIKDPFMPKKRTPEEDLNWAVTRNIIGELLTKHYRACATEELPPRLLALIKKLDHEEPERPEGAPKSNA